MLQHKVFDQIKFDDNIFFSEQQLLFIKLLRNI